MADEEIKKEEKKDDTSGDEEPEVEVEVEKKSSKGKDDDDSEEDEDEKELEKAKQLYNALKDPEQAKVIIKYLADQAGITTSTEKASKTIMEAFKETLGKDYEFMADKLAPAIELLVEARISKLEKDHADTKEKVLEREVDDALKDIRRITKGESKQYEDRMASLMDEVLPSSKISTRDYLRRLYDIARSENAEKTVRQKLAEKASREAKDVSLRTSGAREERLERPERLTLDQAIQAAIKQQQEAQ